MSTGFSIAINAVPFFDLLDQEEVSLAGQVLEAEDERTVTAAMDVSRRRLAQGVDVFVRSLPAVVRNDASVSRAAAYALVGLADERMLHYPAGGLERWRDHLLEFELYGSALAGQEIVKQARASSQGVATSSGGGSSSGDGDGALLAPLYLAVFREGFEGSLRGDAIGLSSLTATLEESVGARRSGVVDVAGDVGPSRAGLSPVPLAVTGAVLWLVSGIALWLVLPGDALEEADRIAERVHAGLPVSDGLFEPLDRSIGPSGLPPLGGQGAATSSTSRRSSGRSAQNAPSETGPANTRDGT